MSRLLHSVLIAVGVALYWLRLHRLIIWLNRRAPKVLLYHACDPRPGPWLQDLRSNTLPADFAWQLALLRKHYRIVPVEALERGDHGDRAVAITFDDGYRSVHEHALPLLRQYDAPATVYLVTSVVENDALVWVNELNWWLRAHPETGAAAAAALGLPPTASVQLILKRAIEGYDPDRLRTLLTELRAKHRVDSRTLARTAQLYLSWTEVAELMSSGISIGNHTVEHPNLARLSPEQQRATMQAANETIVQRCGTCSSIAYPFGLHTAESQTVALATGHRSIMEVGGWNARVEPAAIARIPVQARTPATFFAELEIAAPIRGRLRALLRR